MRKRFHGLKRLVSSHWHALLLPRATLTVYDRKFGNHGTSTIFTIFLVQSLNEP